MNRRGELSSAQIITIVLALAGFVVIALFASSIYEVFQGEDARELCRLSVLTRATAPTVVQAVVPLRCSTEKVCISLSGSRSACPQFVGEDNVRGVKLDKSTPEENARIVERESAEAMYTCWSMMGKGKLDLFNGRTSAVGAVGDSFVLQERQPACVICSRLAVADDVLDDEDGKKALDLVDVRRYMQSTRVPGTTLTYLQTFTDPQIRSFPGDFVDNRSDSGRVSYNSAFVFMQLLTPEDPIEAGTDAAANTGLTYGGALMLTPVGRIALKAPVITLAIGAVLSAGSGVSSYFTQRENQALSAFYCGSFTGANVNGDNNALDDARKGCSLVTQVDYSARAINQICYTIEGNP